MIKKEINKNYFFFIKNFILIYHYKIKKIDIVIKINENNFNNDKIGTQGTSDETVDGISRFYSLNEIVIRDKDLNTTQLKIFIDSILLENFVGDGILISTSVDSTTYNLSFGRSIVYNTFRTLQITPIAPLNSLIIPNNKLIKIIPKKNNWQIHISVDGENNVYDKVLSIETFARDKKIKCLRMEQYNFLEIINKKFLVLKNLRILEV